MIIIIIDTNCRYNYCHRPMTVERSGDGCTTVNTLLWISSRVVRGGEGQIVPLPRPTLDVTKGVATDLKLGAPILRPRASPRI